MFGHRSGISGIQHSIVRTLAPVVTAAVALLALLPQAWSATPTFTVASNVFPSTAVGKSVTQNVTITVNTAVPITSIALGPNFTEYKLGAITGCTIDSSGNTIVAASSVCTIPVTFTPAAPGTASAPPPISRSAPLLVTDIEGGKPNGYSFALSGSATGAVFAFAPGFITSVVGNPSFAGGFGSPGCTNQTDARGDGCPATDAEVYPSSMAVDPAGNIYIADFAEKVIHRVDAATQIINVYAGKYAVQGPSGSGGPATSATFFGPLNITVDQAGNLYLYDVTSGIWEINAASGIATDIGGEGGYTPEEAIAQGKTLAQTTFPEIGALLADSGGSLYVSTYQTGSVYKINLATGLLTAVVGNGTYANPAKGVPGVATSAQLGELTGLALDSKGNLYIGDIGNALVYRVDTAANIAVYAGTQATSAEFQSGCSDDSGDWGPATSAFIGYPASIALDVADNLYIGEPGSQGGESCPIRRVDAATGIIHSVAGDTTQTYGYLSGVGASETYLSPNLVAVDGVGNIYVGEQNIEAGISKISPAESALIFPRQSQYVTSTQLVTASNLGIGDNLTLSNYPFVIAPVPSTATPSPFSNAPLSGTTPEDCSSGTLTPGGVCGILVAYYPTSNVVSTATDTVEDNSLGVAGTTNVINISGNAFNGATASLTPNPVVFASQPVGTPTAATAVQFGIFLNPALTVESVTITGPDASSFSLSAAATSPCAAGSTIANGGGDCNLGVIFNPTKGGPLSATLTVTWISAGVTSSLSAPISGTGAQATPPATPVIYPASNTYNAPVAVGITDATSSATIDYSTDGTTPSIAYTAPFTVSQTATVLAFATEGAGNNSSTTNSTYTIQPYLSFNPASVGVAAGSAQTLNALFSFASSTTPTAALHYGTDYSIGSVACTSPTTGIETCSVPVTFVPTLPGPRKDALILSSGGNTIATVYLGGTGQGPLALVQPGVVTNPVSNFPDYIYNSTVDENGTVYFLTGSANAVYSEPKDGGTPTNLNLTGLANPSAIAVDGAGILYIAPNSGSESYIIAFDPLTNKQSTISMVPPAPFQQCNTGYGPYYDFVGVAVDDLGNIYGLESSCHEVIELQTNGTITVTALSPNDGNLGSVAVDAPANGNPPNIFTSGTNAMNEISYQAQSSINANGAGSIAVDAADTIYATRYTADGYQVAELAASNYSTPQAGLDGGTNGELVDPLGLGLGSDDTLYLGNYQDLDKVDRTQGAIAFGEQQTGIASSSQNVSIYNGGNQALTISNIVLSGSASGFAMTAATTNSCINGKNFATVPVGALCQISVTMTPPHAGNFTGSITFTTNSGNNSKSTAVVALTGYVNGIYLTVSPNPVPFGNQVTGTTSAAMTATVTNNGLLYSANVGGPTEVQADNAFNPTLGTCANVSLAVGQSCQMSITFDPSLQQPYNDTISFQGSSSGGGPNLTTAFGVTGTGVAPPSTTATLTPNPQTFTGQIVGTTSAPAVFTLTNNSATPLSSIVPTITGGNAADFALLTTGTNVCGSTLAGSATCNLYVTFTPSVTGAETTTLSIADNASNTPQTAVINGTGVTFVSNVGTAETAQAVTVAITTAGTSASIQVLTQGATGVDFAEGAGGTCSAATTYTVGQTCTVDVIFDPAKPGIREGSAEVLDASGNVLGIAYLPGLATSPLIAFSPAAQSSLLPASTYTVTGVATSAGGNVFFVDNAGGAVYQMNKSGANLTKIGSGYTDPIGVAVDGAGNVYVGGYADADIIKIPWTGSAYGPQTTVPLGSGSSNLRPYHLTVDSFGNIFFIDYSGNSAVVEVPWTSTGYGSPVVLPFTGLNSASGLAVDQHGDVFVAGGYSQNVLELPWTGTSWGTQVTVVGTAALPGSDGAPEALALDAAGDLYVAEGHLGSTSTEYLLKVPFNGTSYSAPVVIPMTSLGSVTDVALLGGGDIFVGDRFSKQVFALDTQDPPSLNFNTSTNVGSTDTADGPQTATVSNIGNASLALNSGTNPNYPVNFPENTLDTALCTQGAAIKPGTGCDISLNFVPNAGGANKATVTLLDNNLNSASSQNIPVSGNGVAVLIAQVISFTQPATPITWSSSLTVALVATGGASGNPVVFSIDGTSTGTGSISGSTLTITTPGTFVIDANQAGNSTYSAAPQVQRSLMVNKAPQTINFPAPTSPVIYTAGLTVPLTATGGASGDAVVFTIDSSSTATGSISGTTLTVTSTGKLVIDANQAGNTDYLAATQVQQTITVNAQAAQTISFTQPATPITWSSSLTVALVATGGASGNPVVFSIDGTSTGTGSISGSTLSIATPGTFVIDANQAGNASYTAAPQVQRTLVVNKAPQTINFTAPTSPVIYTAGLTVPLTATGGASGDAVVFTIDSSSTATGSISGTTLTVTSTGKLVIDANQAGNTDYLAATQVQQTITVNSPSAQAINFTQPTSPLTYASSLTVALVATGGASGNPVVFSLDSTSTGTGSISGSTLTITSVGTFVIDANQAGNASYTAAPQVQRSLVVNQAPQAINFTQPTSPVTYAAGLTISLTGTGGASGNAVVFTVDSTSTASATISGSTVTVTSKGNLVLDANQAGNADYSAAPQVQRTVVINAAPGDFTIGATPSSQTVTAGNTASFTVTVTGTNSFGNNVNLSVTGYPPGSTASFSPPQINPGDGPATSTLTIATPAGLFAQSAAPATIWPVATPTLALLLLLPFRRWRKAFRGRLLLIVLGLASLASAAALSGCGGGFALPQVSQNYTLTITGTSGSDTHTTTVQLTVQ